MKRPGLQLFAAAFPLLVSGAAVAQNPKSICRIYLTLAMVFMASISFSQKLKVTETALPLSKEAQKKGMYISTTLANDGNLMTYISYDLKKGQLGFDAVSADLTGKVLSSNSEIASSTTANKYGVAIPEPGTVENPAKGKSALRLVSASGVLGSMKVEKGYFEPVYATEVEYGAYITTYTKILRGYKFVEKESFNSNTKINIFTTYVDPEEEIQRDYNVVENPFKIGTVGFFMESSEVAFVGKDARFDKDSPYAQNVLVSGKFTGKTRAFDNLEQIVLEYNCGRVTDGYDAKGNRVVLVSTLNAPTTIAAHKKWQAEGTPYMTYISFDQEGKVQDNVTFKSKSVRGNFGVYGTNGSNYVLGSINAEHTGYYRADIGKPTDFQVVKIENGQVLKQNVVSYEALESKLVVPGGGQTKLKLKDITFTGYEQAANGDFLAFASTGTEYLIFQINADAEVVALYLIGRVPGKEFFELGPQVAKSGNDLYIMYREQSGAIAQGVTKSFSRGAGYMKNVSFSRVDELMTYGRVVKITPEAKACSLPVDFNEDVVLGESPMFISKSGGLLLPVRDSKRNYKLVSIE